jgi:hypothetical protein
VDGSLNSFIQDIKFEEQQRERESDLQGSDTSFSSKSAVEEGSQGVALGQVTFFTRRT